jgi:4-aminobutyrate aminotransferase
MTVELKTAVVSGPLSPMPSLATAPALSASTAGAPVLAVSLSPAGTARSDFGPGLDEPPLSEDTPAPRLKTPRLPGPRSAAAIARDERVMSPSYTRMYPLVIRRGRGAVVEDLDGNLFLDFTAGIAVCSTGHCHPEVVAAVRDQAGQYLHMSGTDFYYEPQIALAEKLAALAPGDEPKKVFFTNSGAEAVEAAFKLARYHTGRPKVVAFYGAFHGRTYGALSLTASKTKQRAHFAPVVPEVHHVPYANCLRCPINLSYPGCKTRCVDFIEDTLLRHEAPPDEVAAIFVEPIQGEGGYVVPPPEFHRRLRALCDKHGILMVADEVQTGMGRTGRMFAMEHWGVAPDITCTAKGIASGMPLGAIIAKARLMNWTPGSHASTFGGNPVSCRAALATIDLLERQYLANAAEVGEHLTARLRRMSADFTQIAQVRGLGLMIGMELVESRASMTPAAGLRNRVVDACFERGLLLLPCGESSIRFCPPLCITRGQADTAAAILAEAMRAEGAV